MFGNVGSVLWATAVENRKQGATRIVWGQITQDQQTTQLIEITESIPATSFNKCFSLAGITLPGYHQPPSRLARRSQFLKSIFPAPSPHRRRHPYQLIRDIPLQAGEHRTAHKRKGPPAWVGQHDRSVLTINSQRFPCIDSRAADFSRRRLSLGGSQVSPVMFIYFFNDEIIIWMWLILNRAGTDS